MLKNRDCLHYPPHISDGILTNLHNERI